MRRGIKLTTPTLRETMLKNSSLIKFKNIRNRTDLIKNHSLKEPTIQLDVDGKDAVIICKS